MVAMVCHVLKNARSRIVSLGTKSSAENNSGDGGGGKGVSVTEEGW